MPEGSPFSPTTPAVGPVQSCPNQSNQPGPVSPSVPPKPVIPCDLKNLTVQLTSDGKTISKSGATNVASPPLPSLTDAMNALLANHAVVIHRAIPTTIMTGATTRAGVTPNVPVTGRAAASAAMKSNCGQHPLLSEDPVPSDPTKKGALSVSTTKWEVSDFGQMIFKGKPWGDLFHGDRSAVTFTASTCGAPAQGNPIGSLKGIAQVAIADEWEITFMSGKGIEIKLDANSTSSRENSYGAGYRGSSTSESASIGGSIESVGLSRSGSVESSVARDQFNRTQNLGNGYQLDTSYSSLTTKTSISSASEDVFVADGERKIFADAKDCFNLEIKRNGTKVFDPSEILEAIEKFAKEITGLFKRYAQLKELFQRGARIAFPMSLSFDLSFALTLLKGSITARIWPDQVRVIQGGSYYIEDRDSKFQLITDLLIAKLDVKPKITATASVLSRYIAAIEVEIEGSVSGSVSVNFRVDYTTAHCVVQAHASMPMSIAAAATGSAASFYVTAQASVSSAMHYTCGAEYSALSLSPANHTLTNDQLSCELVIKRGNKIVEYFGFGEAKEWFRWPKDGPFIWIDAGAMYQTWST